MHFDSKENTFFLELTPPEANWLQDVLEKASLKTEEILTAKELMESYNVATGKSFDQFASSQQWQLIRKNGLLMV